MKNTLADGINMTNGSNYNVVVTVTQEVQVMTRSHYLVQLMQAEALTQEMLPLT